MTRRPMAATVVELATAVQPAPQDGAAIRVTRLGVDVPVEVALGREGSELLLVADLPRWRWRSVFDRQPGRLILQLEAVSP